MTMALLDFLLNPRQQMQQGGLLGETGAPTPPVPDGMVAPSQPVGPMQAPPQTTERPSLLSEAWNWAKSPQGMLTIGTGLRSLGGDQNAGMDAVRIGAQLRQEATQRQQQQKTQEDRARVNAALKASYASGQFDPKALVNALSDADVDLGEIATTARAFEPRRKYVEGPDGIYEIDEDAGTSRRISDFPDEQPNAPSGFRWNETGDGLELIPGYAEGVGQVSGVRRDAVVDRPMPRQGGGRGGRPRSYGEGDVQW